MIQLVIFIVCAVKFFRIARAFGLRQSQISAGVFWMQICTILIVSGALQWILQCIKSPPGDKYDGGVDWFATGMVLAAVFLVPAIVSGWCIGRWKRQRMKPSQTMASVPPALNLPLHERAPSTDNSTPPPVYFIVHGGAKRGPLSLGQLKVFIQQEQLDGSELYWTQGFVDWRPFSDFIKNEGSQL